MRHRTLFFFIILVFFFIKKSTSKLYEVSYDGYNCATSNFHISLQKVLNFTFVILLHIMQHCLWSRQMCIQMKHNYHLHLKHRTKTKILKHKKLFIGKLQLQQFSFKMQNKDGHTFNLTTSSYVASRLHLVTSLCYRETKFFFMFTAKQLLLNCRSALQLKFFKLPTSFFTPTQRGTLNGLY